MRKASLLCLLSLLLALFLAACGAASADAPADAAPARNGEGNTLFNAVRTEGTMDFFLYDGETTRSNYVWGEGALSLLRALKAVSAIPDPDWSPADVTLPIYGITAQTTDYRLFQAAVSNGRLITQDGSAYFFDFDPSIENAIAWNGEWRSYATAIFPCARHLLLDEGRWKTELMLPSPERKAPDGITAELTAWDGTTAAVTFRNDSGKDFTFGTPFSVEYLKNGVGYPIPEAIDEYAHAFTDIGYLLQDGKTWQEKYAVEAYYGKLPAGRYRLIAAGLAVEFTVD